MEADAARSPDVTWGRRIILQRARSNSLSVFLIRIEPMPKVRAPVPMPVLGAHMPLAAHKWRANDAWATISSALSRHAK